MISGRVYKFPAIIAGICVFLAIAGCGKVPKEAKVLASIAGTNITVDAFYDRILKLPARYQAIVNRRKGEFLQELISDALLYRESIRLGLDRDKDVLGVIEEAKKKILIAKLLKNEVDDAINVTDEDVKKYYMGNKEKYMTPEIMRVSHILVPSREEADIITREIAKGAIFENVARAKSVDPTAQRGGDIGYFPKGQLMPEFESACAQLKVNEISDVVKTKLGYHILKLTDRRKPELRQLKQVKDSIKSLLRTGKRQKLFNDLLSRLREETDVKINEEVLSELTAKNTNGANGDARKVKNEK